MEWALCVPGHPRLTPLARPLRWNHDPHELPTDVVLPRASVIAALATIWRQTNSAGPTADVFAQSVTGEWLADAITQNILLPHLSEEVATKDHLDSVHWDLSSVLGVSTMLSMAADGQYEIDLPRSTMLAHFSTTWCGLLGVTTDGSAFTHTSCGDWLGDAVTQHILIPILTEAVVTEDQYKRVCRAVDEIIGTAYYLIQVLESLMLTGTAPIVIDGRIA